MKNIFLLLFLFSTIEVSSQSPTAITNNPPVPYSGNVEWGSDFLVSSTAPGGISSGVYRNSNSTIYVSLPDSNIQSGAAIVILTSTDNGGSWSNIAAVTPADVIPKTKMVRSAADSIYCFFLRANTLFCWNVLNNRVTQVRGIGFRDFDVAASSTGSMYVFMDSLGTNNLIRYGSSDGGVVWGQRGLISSGAAHPRVCMSALGDTLVLNYFGPVLADTSTSIIRNARYRESAPGTMAVVGSFTDIVAAGAHKEQFQCVSYGRFVWFLYTSETGGVTSLKCKVSSNSTVSYSDAPDIGNDSTLNKFRFDARHHTRTGGGVDLIYSLKSGTEGLPVSIKYATANTNAQSSFSVPVPFSQHAPVTSSSYYIPVLIPYGAGGDAGAVWVGDDGGNSRQYFARLLQSSTLNLAMNFEACPNTDTIDVQLRNSISPYEVYQTVRGLGGQGITRQFQFNSAVNGVNYYLVLKHRNSIETWSKSGGAVFNSGTLNYDFTTAASQAFGDNMVLVGSDYSVYTGDVTQDGTVDLSDIVLIFNDASLFVTGYVVTDLNCDDFVDLTDIVFAFNNSSLFISVIRP